jgi:hypothetical protein
MTAPDFATWQAICDTKARYCRCLDSKDWAGYADVFTPDAVLDTRGAGGALIAGRAALVEMVRGSIGDAVTVHQVHSPEIRLTGPDSAEAVFAMQDRVIWGAEKAQAVGRRSLTGYGHYHEEYRLGEDGHWRIARSALTRLHVDFEQV